MSNSENIVGQPIVDENGGNEDFQKRVTSDSGQSPEGVARLLMGKMPKVQQHVVDQHKPELKQQEKVDYSHIKTDATDRRGRPFHPDLHMVKDGQPVITKYGNLKIRPKTERDFQEIPPAVQADINIAKLQQQRHMAAVLITSNLLNIGVIAFGDEWQPEPLGEGVNEFDILVQSTEQYLESKGVDDFPPGIALAVCWSGYAIKRATREKTKGKLERLGNWFKMQILKFRNRKLTDA